MVSNNIFPGVAELRTKNFVNDKIFEADHSYPFFFSTISQQKLVKWPVNLVYQLSLHAGQKGDKVDELWDMKTLNQQLKN